MSETTVRTHVILPRDLVDAVDKVVGRRRRSRFVAEAVQEKLARLRLLDAARKAAGSLADLDIPGWETGKTAAEWVRALRRADSRRIHRTQREP